MNKKIFFIGGANSGKSMQAEKYINSTYEKKIYLATGIPFDTEMKEKIKKHQLRRDNSWHTVESFKDIVAKIDNLNIDYSVILFDCVTNLITNIMLENPTINWENIDKNSLDNMENTAIYEIINLIEYCNIKNIDIIFVSNEVNLSLVPEYPLGRYFAGITGRINQYIANISDEVYLVVAGLKTKLK